MKNIKYILSLLLLLTIVSCGDDSFSREYIDTEDKIELAGTIALADPNTLIYAGDDVEFTVTIPQTFDVEATVEVTVKSVYNVINVAPNVEKIYVTIPVGTTSFSGSFEMPNFDFEAPFLGISDFASVSITGIALEEGTDDPYTMTSEPVALRLFEPARNGWTNPREKTLLMSLDWEGPYASNENDLDLFLYDTDLNVRYEFSWDEGTRFEGDYINNRNTENYPNGDYIVVIEAYNYVNINTPIPYRLVFTYPDGTREIYNGTINPSVDVYAYPVIVTKTTDTAGNPVYSTAANT